MVILYRCLLRLYPAAYRREFAKEMICVFCHSDQAARSKRFSARAKVCARQVSGLLAGALRERLRTIFGIYDWISFTSSICILSFVSRLPQFS
jgi:hypothetical protein